MFRLFMTCFYEKIIVLMKEKVFNHQNNFGSKVGLHGDKTYNTFCLWKHHVNKFAVIHLRGVSTNKKYYNFASILRKN